MIGTLDSTVAPPHALTPDVRTAVARFLEWLDAYGETSYDHQSFFAGRGGAAKALYYRHPLVGTAVVAPLIACEAFLPAARQLFWKRQRFPIADAHYASGFAFLAETDGLDAHYDRAVAFLRVLLDTRSPRQERHGWGYPFDWVTVRGTMTAGTPMITTLPYVYEAFEQVYRLDGDRAWSAVLRSIAEHALLDYREHPSGPDAASCSYTPNPLDEGGVVNASAYRAVLLAKAGIEFDDDRYRAAARRSVNFVLQSQNPDGSWCYAVDGQRTFVDHFHTCFVLKALAKIEAFAGDYGCAPAIQHGVDYYVRHLFDEQRLPKPFARRPRLTVYRRELYDYAECINLAVLLARRSAALDATLTAVVSDLLRRWRKPDGSFRSRELLIGWDNVPMHRWAQAQLFRSLCLFIRESGRAGRLPGKD